MSYRTMMGCVFTLVRGKIIDVEDVHASTFAGPNSAIISDSCNYVRTCIGILIELGFPLVSL